MAEIGEVVLADGCLFLDRIRSRDKNAFDWGLWGGGCVPAPEMAVKNTSGSCQSNCCQLIP